MHVRSEGIRSRETITDRVYYLYLREGAERERERAWSRPTLQFHHHKEPDGRIGPTPLEIPVVRASRTYVHTNVHVPRSRASSVETIGLEIRLGFESRENRIWQSRLIDAADCVSRGGPSQSVLASLRGIPWPWSTCLSSRGEREAHARGLSSLCG